MSAFTRSMSFLSALLLLLAFNVSATEVMHRPDNYKSVPFNVTKFALDRAHNHTVKRTELTQVANGKRAGSKVQAAYFVNWGIYGRNFQPTDVVPAPLTHILYAFADVDPNSGTISLTDSYADVEKHFPNDSWDESGTNMYGCLKQLYLLKLKQRNLKVLLSIGGWTYSQSGHFNFTTNPTSVSTFVTSAVSMVENYGFDGIDIDFEYPSSTAHGQGFASLVTQLRSAFDKLASQKGDKTPYEISAAVAAGPANYQFLDIKTMNSALTHWNLMAYDYAGSWSPISDDMANLFPVPVGSSTNISTDQAVKDYISKGASASKIVMGIPMYGRSFEQTNGIRQPYNGIGPGTFEAGVVNYNVMPLPGANVVENSQTGSSYTYDSSAKELISYDSPNIVSQKAKYVVSSSLAGAMFWELSSDKKGADSLVNVAQGVFGGLDQTQNHINYPNSKYDNLKNNFGGSSTGTTTGSAPSSTPTSGGTCTTASAWSSSSVYTAGMTAKYNGHLWTAKWWTQGDTPGGSAGAWTDNGAC